MKFIKKLFGFLFKDPRTTVAGITSTAAGGSMIAGMVKGGIEVTPETISTAGGLIATGLGLVFSKDTGKD